MKRYVKARKAKKCTGSGQPCPAYTLISESVSLLLCRLSILSQPKRENFAGEHIGDGTQTSEH